MRLLLVKCCLAACVSYPLQSLAEVSSPTPIFKGDKLLIVSQAPKSEPLAKFITLRELDSYYENLLFALKRRQPERDASYFAAKGQRYLLQTQAKMTRDQQARYQPAELYDGAVQNVVNRVCPRMRIVEGEADSHYIDFSRLARVINKQEPAPQSQQLLPIELSPTATYPTKMFKLYQLTIAEYVSRWNGVMYTECKRVGGAPDINRIPPVRVTHKVVNNTVFILDEPPFTNPRTNDQSELRRAIYNIRLARAMRQKNVEADLQAAIRQQQTYFLGQKWEAVADWFGPGPRPKNFVPRHISYGVEEGNIDAEEVAHLAKVCPVRVLEGLDSLSSGQWGTIDFANPVGVQPHHEEMRQLSKNTRDYERRWNQVMLSICREKLNKQK